MANTNKPVHINKAESTTSTPVPITTERGQPHPAKKILNFVQDLKEQQLKMPYRIPTFDEMCMDSDVRHPLEISQILPLLSIVHGGFEGVKGSLESEEVAKFANYAIHNMTYGTWYEACNNFVTSVKYGFSNNNIVLEKRKFGQYAGDYVIKKISPRSQESLYGWIYDDKLREVKGIVQNPMIAQRNTTIGPGFRGAITASNAISLRNSDYVPIMDKNLLRFVHNPTNNNPQGNSPLVAAFEDWAEKEIIQQYEVIGVSKDLGGLVVVRVADELLRKAQSPDKNPDDYRAYLDLENQIANIHAGKQSYIMLSDEMNEGSYSYDIKLMGIEGNGKQYKTSEVIEQKRKSIYNVFGAGYLLLGQDSSGSYNLSTSGRLTHSFYVERTILEIVNVLNNNLLPKLLAANGIFLDYEKMPKFVPAEPDQLSLDEGSKFIQRVGSVGKITPQALSATMKLMGFEDDEGLSELDFSSKGDSRAGESQGSSGTGNSQDGGIGSPTNMENTGVTKQKTFVIDSSYEKDGRKMLIDIESGKSFLANLEEQ